jgi:D-3-phosphoglycerate dehydrogenase
MQIANDRGFRIVEQREPGKGQVEGIRVELETESGTFTAAGAVVLDKPRLMQVKDISCEVTLDGHLMYSLNEDVPGVIGFLGTVLGRNGINIANFALGRQDGTGSGPRTAVSIVETDERVPESVISQLYENKAVKYIRSVSFPRV